ncbi:PilW family protein [Niallia sp. Krafla_26]|uniref:PilW family protein n=1 Tax=Niallia sp. Krafla_26 TaxID=3064703 RepID=UPI003D16C04B
MNNQKGITLVELLVVITIMSFAIFVPMSLFNLSIKTEKDVRIENELQREARFVIEYITKHVRDGAFFEKEPTVGGDIFLKVENEDSTITSLLQYDSSANKVYLDPEYSSQIISQHIVEFTWDDTSNLLYLKFVLDNIDYEVSTEISKTRIRGI